MPFSLLFFTGAVAGVSFGMMALPWCVGEDVDMDDDTDTDDDDDTDSDDDSHDTGSDGDFDDSDDSDCEGWYTDDSDDDDDYYYSDDGVEGGGNEDGLTQEELRRLPWFFAYGGGSGGDRCCSICLEEMRDGERCQQLARCRHALHAACVDKWLTTSRTCPCCRNHVLVSPAAAPTRR